MVKNMTNTKNLRRKYRKELISFLRNNGFECEYKGKWYCIHENDYYVIIDRNGILFKWEYEKTADEYGTNTVDLEIYSSKKGIIIINEYLRRIIDYNDVLPNHGDDIILYYRRFIPWELLEENENEFREELEKLKEFIMNVKDYRVYFTVEIKFHIEKR